MQGQKLVAWEPVYAWPCPFCYLMTADNSQPHAENFVSNPNTAHFPKDEALLFGSHASLTNNYDSLMSATKLSACWPIIGCGRGIRSRKSRSDAPQWGAGPRTCRSPHRGECRSDDEAVLLEVDADSIAPLSDTVDCRTDRGQGCGYAAQDLRDLPLFQIRKSDPQGTVLTEGRFMPGGDSRILKDRGIAQMMGDKAGSVEWGVPNSNARNSLLSHSAPLLHFHASGSSGSHREVVLIPQSVPVGVFGADGKGWFEESPTNLTMNCYKIMSVFENIGEVGRRPARAFCTRGRSPVRR